MKKYVNNELVEMTTEEVSSFETEAELNKSKSVERKESEAQFKTNKTNAKAKLIAGEALTEDEANTIVL
jgi:hypothetical protein